MWREALSTFGVKIKIPNLELQMGTTLGVLTPKIDSRYGRFLNLSQQQFSFLEFGRLHEDLSGMGPWPFLRSCTLYEKFRTTIWRENIMGDNLSSPIGI